MASAWARCCACGETAVEQVDHPAGGKIDVCMTHLQDYESEGAEKFCAEHPQCVGGPPSPV